MGRKIRIDIPLYILSVLWNVWLVNHLLPFELGFLGILPRTFSGLKGILFAPFIHANMNHLLANSGSFLILSTGLFTFLSRDRILCSPFQRFYWRWIDLDFCPAELSHRH